MIKILDRYIIQTFLVSLAIVLVAMMSLALMLDLFFNYNKFLDISLAVQKAGYWDILAGIADYYFYKSLDYFQMLAAPSLNAAAAASLVRFNRARELTGMKAAGISLYRIMWPMIVAALILDAFYIVNQEIIIPSISVQLSHNPDDLAVRKEFSVDFIRDENNNIIYSPTFDPKTAEMVAQKKLKEDGTELFLARVRIFLRDSNYQTRGTIEAERAKWDTEARGWRLTNGMRLPPPRETQVLGAFDAPEGDPVDFYSSNVGPAEIRRHRAGDYHRYMAYGELKVLAEDPMRGNRRQLQVSLHEHVTGPIMNILLLLLALPFVAGRDDRNYFASIGIAMGLTIAVFAITFAATAFGNTGHLGPVTAAWLPVLIVLPASIVSMEALRT